MSLNPSTLPLPTTRGPSWKWWVCGLLLLATMLNYMDRLTLNLLSKRIMDEIGMSKLDYGELESGFAYAFALGAILFGWMADRINVRWLYPVVLLAWSAAGFATGLVEGFLMLWLCRFSLGFCEAGHWPCALKTTQHILPPEKRSLGNGILQSGAALGAIFTPFIIDHMVQGTEPGLWRAPFLVIGGVGCLWVVFWLFSVKSRDLQQEFKPSSASLMGILFILLALLGFDLLTRLARANAENWFGESVGVVLNDEAVPLFVKGLVFLASFWAVFSWLRKATADDTHLPRKLFFRRFLVLLTVVIVINCTWHFFRVWLPLFLQEERGYTEKEMRGFMIAYYVSTDLGSLAVGFFTLGLLRTGLSTHSSRVTVFAIFALFCLLSLVVGFLPGGPLLFGILLVIGFAALSLFPTYYSLTQELTAQHQGKITGSLGCINWTATYFLQDLFGRSIEMTGSYAVGLALAGIGPLLGVGVLIFFWNNREQSENGL